MSVNYTFTEEFLDNLAKARKDMDLLLVCMLRMVQSENISENIKIEISRMLKMWRLFVGHGCRR
jgi:hypothetical protein